MLQLPQQDIEHPKEHEDSLPCGSTTFLTAAAAGPDIRIAPRIGSAPLATFLKKSRREFKSLFSISLLFCEFIDESFDVSIKLLFFS